MEKKEEKSSILKMVVELPRPTIQPVNRRIYCLAVRTDEVKTKGGIYIPTEFNKNQGEQQQYWEFKRYFVVAVAEDWDITFKDETTNEIRKPRRGDEVVIFYHEDALRYSPAMVVDFGNSGEKYCVFHQEEIAGMASKPPLIEEGEEKKKGGKKE